MEHLTTEQLEAGLGAVRASPADHGVLELIVRRPFLEGREVVDEAQLDPTVGLVGDCWATRGSTSTADGNAHPDRQLTLMNVRLAALVAGDRQRWALAGDQLYVDFDLGVENLPPGSRLRIGSAIVEVTAEPHTGCAKFTRRFGLDALRFVNSPTGKDLRLRGMNAKVLEAGVIRRGDAVTKV